MWHDCDIDDFFLGDTNIWMVGLREGVVGVLPEDKGWMRFGEEGLVILVWHDLEHDDTVNGDALLLT